jgi:hypothetical protein
MKLKWEIPLSAVRSLWQFGYGVVDDVLPSSLLVSLKEEVDELIYFLTFLLILYFFFSWFFFSNKRKC